MSSSAPRLSQIVQVCIVSTNFDQTVRTLAEGLGIGPWKCWHYRPPTLFATQLQGVAQPWTMQLGIAWTGQVQLEVIQPMTGPTLYQQFLQKRSVGLHHLLVNFAGLNLAQATAALAAQGYAAAQSAKLNVPIQLGPITIPAVPSFLANSFNTHFTYYDTVAKLKTVLETSQLPPGIPFRLGMNLGKAEAFVPSTARDLELPLPTRLITEITKVGLLTRDLAATQKAYTDTVGVSHWQVSQSGQTAHAQIGATTLELTQPSSGIYQTLLEQHGEGLHYLGVTTGLGVAAAVEKFKAAQCPLILNTTNAQGQPIALVDAQAYMGAILEVQN